MGGQAAQSESEYYDCGCDEFGDGYACGVGGADVKERGVRGLCLAGERRGWTGVADRWRISGCWYRGSQKVLEQFLSFEL